MKLLFIQGPSLYVRLVSAILLSIALMVLDHRFHKLEPLRATLSAVVYPLQYVVNVPFKVVSWLDDSITSQDDIELENQRLKAEHLLLKAKIQKFEALELENMRLRALLESSFQLNDRVLVAEIIRVNLDPYQHQVIINKGTHNDAFQHQPVLDAEGIVGQIVHVGPMSAVTTLITDVSHAIPVRVNRNNLRTVAMGTGDLERLALPFLPVSADIQEGDLLVTSGLGGRFPPGYPVARVTRIERDPGHAFSSIEAKPTANLGQINEVLLVWENEKQIKLGNSFDEQISAQDETVLDEAAGAQPQTEEANLEHQ